MLLEEERAKWDAIYKDPGHAKIDPRIEDFNGELVAAIQAILPAGSRIAELGCGAATHSIALAQTGRYHLTCVDFSTNALEAAQRSFECHGLQAEFRQENVFENGERQFDLVFNAGVLEHYTLDEQAAFLQGMASRSRQYVLAIIPNSLCYWYWIWRLRVSSAGQWPYGKEVPRCQWQDVFAGAGLDFMGQRFFGSSWSELFIEQTAPEEGGLRDAILRAHRAPCTPKAHKCYLVAGLGALPGASAAWVKNLGWKDGPETIDFTRDQLATAVVDALAANMALEARLAAAERRIPTPEPVVAGPSPQVLSDEDAAEARVAAAHEHAAGQVLEKTCERLVDEKARLQHELERLTLENSRLECLQGERATLQRRLEVCNCRVSHLLEESELLTFQTRELERLLAQRASGGLRSDAAPPQAPTLRSAARINIEFGLSLLQRLTPGPVRRAVRGPYLNYFYYPLFPNRRPSGQPRAEDGSAGEPAPVSRQAQCFSGYSPFIDYKRQLCRGYGMDLTSLSASSIHNVVSIVLPVYNGSRHVAESIESVLGQSHQALELIVVDDGSTDETPDIVKSYLKDPRARLIQQPNQKLPAALSNGFHHARGEFFTWTSDDNIMEPDSLAELVSSLRSQPDAEMVYADVSLIDEAGRPLLESDFYPGYQTPPGSNTISFPRDPGPLHFVQNNYIGACFLYRAWAGRVLGAYAPGTFGYEDYEYWMRMTALFRMIHIGHRRPLYRYRVHEHSLSSQEKELRIADRVREFIAGNEERRRFYVNPSDVTLVGEHPSFNRLTQAFRAAGENLFHLNSMDSTKLYHFRNTRAYDKSVVVMHAALGPEGMRDCVDKVRSSAPNSVMILMVETEAEARNVTENLLAHFDFAIATTEEGWVPLHPKAPLTAIKVLNPDALPYTLSAIGNNISEMRRRQSFVDSSSHTK